MIFFLKEPATPQLYTLSLHDALPISPDRRASRRRTLHSRRRQEPLRGPISRGARPQDRKSTRLNSSHPSNSYAVFCLKKKTKPTEMLLVLRQYDSQRDE